MNTHLTPSTPEKQAEAAAASPQADALAAATVAPSATPTPAAETELPEPPQAPFPVRPKQSLPVEPASMAKLPNLPPIPIHKEKAGVDAVKPTLKTPNWWRLGMVPALVLIMAAAIGDLLSFSHHGIGIAAGIACVILCLSIILLRKDLSIGEISFICGVGLISGVATVTYGSGLAVLCCIIIPLFILMLPTKASKYTQDKPTERYRNWWTYWTTRSTPDSGKNKEAKKTGSKTKFGTYVLSALVCLAIFVVFIRIFAMDNPVVDMIWNQILEAWRQAMEYLNLCWEHLTHAVFWVLGILAYGIYTIRRTTLGTAIPRVKPLQQEPEYCFPFISFSILLGINLAFLVVTSTDIAFLWLNNIPEGISHTEYLYEGTYSITVAAVLASLVLLLIFLPGSMAKRSGATKFMAYLLILQTFLLAASVYLRLYNLVEYMGFTLRRVLAAEVLVLGIIGIVILLLYIACTKNFRHYVKICVGTTVLLIIAQTIIPPTRMVGELNMYFCDSHPHWKFTAQDFKFNSNRQNIEDHLSFALFIYRRDPSPWFANELTRAAEILVNKKAAGITWHNNNLRLQQDLQAAEEILNDSEIAAEAMRSEQNDEASLWRFYGR